MSRLDQIFRELGFKDKFLPPREDPPERCRPPKGPCGKSCYESERRVKQAIRNMLKSGKTDTSRLRPYFCKTCHSWHMTASERWRQ